MMNRINLRSTDTKTGLMTFLAMALIVGLLFSRFLLTVSMIAFIVLALIDWKKEPKLSISLNPKLTELPKLLIANKSLSVITLFFFIVLMSGIYSEDMGYWLERLRIKLPFLFLPLSFVLLPKMNTKQYQLIHYFLLAIVTLSGIGVLLNFGLHYDAILENMSRGQAVPTPINHIRFSLLVAYSVLAGIYLLRNPMKTFTQVLPKVLTITATFFLFVLIHLLAVRSGLAVLYMALGAMTLHYIWYSKKWAAGVSLLLILISLPVVAYFTVPSFRAKLYYMEHDWHQYRNGLADKHSDAERWISYEVALNIIRAHPIIGVGAGDLKKEVLAAYAVGYPKITHPKMPHNQFISVTAGTGLIGLGIFLVAFFTPLLTSRHFRDAHFLGFYVIIFFSFFIENTIENAIGVAFFLFPLLLWLQKRVAYQK